MDLNMFITYAISRISRIEAANLQAGMTSMSDLPDNTSKSTRTNNLDIIPSGMPSGIIRGLPATTTGGFCVACLFGYKVVSR